MLVGTDDMQSISLHRVIPSSPTDKQITSLSEKRRYRFYDLTPRIPYLVAFDAASGD